MKKKENRIDILFEMQNLSIQSENKNTRILFTPKHK